MASEQHPPILPVSVVIIDNIGYIGYILNEELKLDQNGDIGQKAVLSWDTPYVLHTKKETKPKKAGIACSKNITG
jgi:hypothetical protein